MVIVSGSGSAARPNTVTPVMPKSWAKIAICEVTIRPEVDIMVIIKNISQNSGWRSISPGRNCRWAGAPMVASRCVITAGGGTRSPCAVIKPMAAKISPNSHRVWLRP